MANPLVLKGLIGLGAVATVGTGGIILHKNGFFTTKEASVTSNQLKESLLNKLKRSGLKFTVARDDNISEAPITFPKEITFTTEVKLENKNWTGRCKIQLLKQGNGGVTWDTAQKEIFTKEKTGFLSRIKSPANDYESTKERFIENCFSSSTIDSSKNTFESNESFTLNNTKFEENKFNDWFKDNSLETTEKTTLESSTLTLGDLTDDKNTKTLTVSVSGNNNPSSCTVSLPTSEDQTIKTELSNKFNPSSKDTTDEHKRYRRGFFKKCKNHNNKLSLKTSDISSLFDFSDETPTEAEKKLKDVDWTVDNVVTSNESTTITMTASATGETGNTSYSCKVIGIKEDDSATNLDGSKETIKKSIEDQINPTNNKETARENFLNRCKRTWNNTIKLELTESSGSYSLKDLDDIFK